MKTIRQSLKMENVRITTTIPWFDASAFQKIYTFGFAAYSLGRKFLFQMFKPHYRMRGAFRNAAQPTGESYDENKQPHSNLYPSWAFHGMGILGGSI